MPVTAKLSKKFYEALGEDVANELVEWFNKVDATCRTDLRELNELNFSRFDAKLEQRLAEYDAKWERRLTELDTKWERRFAVLDAKWEHRFAEFDGRIAKFDLKLQAVEHRFEARLAETRAELLKWMFLFWAGTVIPLAGLIVALAR